MIQNSCLCGFAKNNVLLFCHWTHRKWAKSFLRFVCLLQFLFLEETLWTSVVWKVTQASEASVSSLPGWNLLSSGCKQRANYGFYLFIFFDNEPCDDKTKISPTKEVQSPCGPSPPLPARLGRWSWTPLCASVALTSCQGLYQKSGEQPSAWQGEWGGGIVLGDSQ